MSFFVMFKSLHEAIFRQIEAIVFKWSSHYMSKIIFSTKNEKLFSDFITRETTLIFSNFLF